MLLTKIAETIPQVSYLENLVNYGALGIMAFAMATALWFLLKRVIKAEDELKEKVESLHSQINEYIRDDQSKMREVIDHNSRAMTELRDVIMKALIK